MIPASFEYIVPSSIEDAIAELGRHGEDAKLLAGGHSLLPLVKLRLARPGYLVDIGRLPGLSYIREEDGVVAIGALTTHHAVEGSEVVRSRLPLLAEAAAEIGDLQVRNRGTLGGSLAHADPAADLPGVCLALDAEIVATGPGGRRTIRAQEFFTGVLATALGPDEILTEVRFPVPAAGTGSAYLKFAHPASGYAVVGVAATVTLDGSGRCSRASIGVNGVAGVPFRAAAAEAALAGTTADAPAAEDAAARAVEGVSALGDTFASSEYRLHLARVQIARAIQTARARAG